MRSLQSGRALPRLSSPPWVTGIEVVDAIKFSAKISIRILDARRSPFDLDVADVAVRAADRVRLDVRNRDDAICVLQRIIRKSQSRPTVFLPSEAKARAKKLEPPS